MIMAPNEDGSRSPFSTTVSSAATSAQSADTSHFDMTEHNVSASQDFAQSASSVGETHNRVMVHRTEGPAYLVRYFWPCKK